MLSRKIVLNLLSIQDSCQEINEKLRILSIQKHIHLLYCETLEHKHTLRTTKAKYKSTHSY